MREGYFDLRKLNAMTDWEWDQLAEEELSRLSILANGALDGITNSVGRVPSDDPSRPVLKRPR